MSQQPRVFEFAKEVGLETLALMNKIREWGLPVKSHMVALDPEVIEDIKNRLSEEANQGKKKKTAKKKTAKKAATKKSTTTKKTAAKKTTTKKKAVPKAPAPVKMKAAGTKGEEAAVEEAPAAKKVVRKASSIIRRKKADIEAAAKEEDVAAQAAAATEEAAAVETPVVEVPVDVEAKKEETPAATEAGAAEAKAEEAEKEAAADASAEEAKDAKPAPAARRVAVNVASGEKSGVRSTPKNIIGRMDLSRLKPAGGERSKSNNRDESASGDVRTPRTAAGARTIRPGFVAAPSPMTGPPDIAADNRKKFDDAKKQPPKKPGGGKETAQQPQSFSTAEFRKREMVFQPKKKKAVMTRESMKTEITTPKASKRVVRVNQSISVMELAQEMGIKAPQLVKVLMKEGVMAKATDKLDFDTVALIVPEFGWEAVNVHKTASELVETAAFGELEADMVTRPPVVTVMGHVDHGKTTLLDSIRKANVVSGEAGGITQHIAAYRVQLDKDKVMTFIDTPGHAAFTAMRERGANSTDIVIIVVAADDGAMPQTVEAINHAKAAGVPIIVAVNKIDKPDANADKIMQQMTEYELVPEEWGGDTMFVKVSALNGDGIEELLEQIHLQAEVLELKANPKRSAKGVVVESRMEKGRGYVATLLVQEGTIKVGQHIVAGEVFGKIRSLMSDQGKNIKDAGPSVPVEMLGLSAAPVAGDLFSICEDENAAKDIAEARAREKDTTESTVSVNNMSLDALFAKVKSGNVKELPIVLKTDVAGSAEAIRGMFDKIDSEEVKVKVIHSAVGAVSESDVLLASSSGGIVIGFNVRPDTGAAQAAKNKNVEVKTYRIVYELLDDLKKAMSGLLEPEIVENVQGRAEIRDTFSVPKIGMIGGCSVIDGKIARPHLARLTRNGVVIYEGKISSLKRFKDDVKEVQSGYECGIGIENFNDLKVGDVIEAYTQESIARELD